MNSLNGRLARLEKALGTGRGCPACQEPRIVVRYPPVGGGAGAPGEDGPAAPRCERCGGPVRVFVYAPTAAPLPGDDEAADDRGHR